MGHGLYQEDDLPSNRLASGLLYRLVAYSVLIIWLSGLQMLRTAYPVSVDALASQTEVNSDPKPGLTSVVYEMLEEAPVPMRLGNLVADFNLTDWSPQTDVVDPSPVLESQGPNINQSARVPWLQLFPSRQPASRFFTVQTIGPRDLQLTLIEPFDREQECLSPVGPESDANGQNVLASPAGTASSAFTDDSGLVHSTGGGLEDAWSQTDRCRCYTRAVDKPEQTVQDRDPYCVLVVTIAAYPLETRMRLFSVRLLVHDINDQAPQFQPSAQFTTSFSESPGDVGARKRLPVAVDADIGSNAALQYHLQAVPTMPDPSDDATETSNLTAPFLEAGNSLVYFGLQVDHESVSESTGNRSVTSDRVVSLQLVLRRALDREIVSVHRLNVVAVDGLASPNMHRHSSTLSLTVFVDDVNDSPPIFQTVNGLAVAGRRLEEVNLAVREDAPVGWLVAKLTATDADVGRNARLHYRLGERTAMESKKVRQMLIQASITQWL
ncbi:unnamed protein product [Protopolystoma xenopodis]|uniref:Cadherin domain-containing protein n=1 Tax=Protopolystoma xenopodis TaxID=117903 RepID=A0A3S5BLZ9_9PLAT|nr:unnamed protein product [Protopolystoma xenopodis]